ncbi:MAG: hypothetical protein AAGE76_04125 [Pseudomonadota bacterium]
MKTGQSVSNTAIFGVFFLYSFAVQQVTYFVSALFTGLYALAFVFGNSAQLLLNSLFFSAILTVVFLLLKGVLRTKLKLKVGDRWLISVFYICIPLWLFWLSVRPSSIPLDFNYRGCAVRVAGELTACGLWSALSDLIATLLVGALIFLCTGLVRFRAG